MADTEEKLPEQWSDMKVESRLLEALRDLRWSVPTTVQRACIPQALRGRDVSIQSRTGSGKTAAFAIPMIQRLLIERNKPQQKIRSPVGLIVVPSVELCEQISEVLNSLCKYIKPRVVVDNLSLKGTVTNERILAADIVVSTAALMGKHLRTGVVSNSSLQGLKLVAVDEADMVLSISARAMRLVQSALPQALQAIMCSATLTEGVASIKGLLLHNPTNIILSNDDGPVKSVASAKGGDAAAENAPIVESHFTLKDPTHETLKQYYLVATDECHSHTLLFAVYRLRLVEGKTIIFVSDEQETYKLQHFLEQLGIAAVVYDATLPVNVRLDMLRRFQKGEVATLICTDSTLESAERADLGGAKDAAEEDEETQEPTRKSRRLERGGLNRDLPNSALHRGIDFSKVQNVIIFDGIDKPSNINFARYTHRVGRCGRAGQKGTSIIILTVPQATHNLRPLKDYVKSRDEVFRPFKQMLRSEAGKLQYRVDTVLNNVTRNATKKLRVATVASELARSSYLSTHMSERDTDAIRKIVQKSSKAVRVDKNLLDVPEYFQLRHVDNIRSYTERVNASQQTKQEVFYSATKTKKVDPLQEVVSSLRKSKKAPAKKAK